MARIVSIFLVALFLGGKAIAAPVAPLSLLLKSSPVTGSGISQNALHKKLVVVTFFASWCPPCTNEFQTLNEIRKEFPDSQLTIIAVNVFEQWGGKKHPSRMKRFLSKTNPKFKVVIGDDHITAAFGNIKRIPTLIIYDRNNKEIWRFVHQQGGTKMSATTEEIRAVLNRLN